MFLSLCDPCDGFFLIAMVKFLSGILRVGGFIYLFICSWSQSIIYSVRMGGGGGRQWSHSGLWPYEWRPPCSHLGRSGRKGMPCSAQYLFLVFFFFSPGSQPMGCSCCCSHSGRAVFPQPVFPGNTLMDTQGVLREHHRYFLIQLM